MTKIFFQTSLKTKQKSILLLTFSNLLIVSKANPRGNDSYECILLRVHSYESIPSIENRGITAEHHSKTFNVALI